MIGVPIATYDAAIDGDVPSTLAQERPLLSVNLEPSYRNRVMWLLFQHGNFGVGNEAWVVFERYGQEVLRLPAQLRRTAGEYLGFALSTDFYQYMQNGAMVLTWNTQSSTKWYQIQPFSLPSIEADKVKLVLKANACTAGQTFFALLGCQSYPG